MMMGSEMNSEPIKARKSKELECLIIELGMLQEPPSDSRTILDDTLGDNPQYAEPDEQLQSL